MPGYQKSNFKYILYLLIMLLIILAGLNLHKFRLQNSEVVPVWSSHDRLYYMEEAENKNIVNRIEELVSPDSLIYKLTRIRIKVPITYLKREIPLLGYYTPESLQKSEKKIYQPELEENKLVKLSFDLRQTEQRGKNDEKNKSNQSFKPDLSNNKPLIAIYHTHTSETFIDDPRPQDKNGHVLPGEIGNIAAIGQELAQTLSQKYGFKVVHTTKVHDENYMRAYFNSRQTLKEIISDNPNIYIALDLHRDGLKISSEKDITTIVNGKKAAKVMIVVTNGRFQFANLEVAGHHPQWEQNLHFAHRFAAKMEEMYPGLLKRVEIRDTTYNQDLHPHGLLLEMGDYKNTTQEVLRSTAMVADIIAALYYTESSQLD